MKSLSVQSKRLDSFHAYNVEGGESNTPASEGFSLMVTLCRSRQRDADMRVIPRDSFQVVTDLEGLQFLYTQLGRFLNE